MILISFLLFIQGIVWQKNLSRTFNNSVAFLYSYHSKITTLCMKLWPCNIMLPFVSIHTHTHQAVDYRGISQSKKFERYVRATAELKRVDMSSLSREEKLAFFINIYNALVIHAFVVQGPPTNMWKRFRVSGHH